MNVCWRSRRVVIALVGLLGACNTVPNPSPPLTGCAADDPRVGQTAVLRGYLHGVSGTARIVDNCTIDIENFSYDGIGMDVRVVGFKDNDVANGIPLTANIRYQRESGYNNETLTVPLPEGVTLDDIEGVAILCETFQINFGDGICE
jgi:hypothetical protein